MAEPALLPESTDSPAQSPPPASPPWMRRVGWAMSGLMILFLLFDGLSKIALEQHVVAATAAIGYPLALIRPLGVICLGCTIFYVIPRTSLLGAICSPVTSGALLPAKFASKIRYLAPCCLESISASSSGVDSICGMLDCGPFFNVARISAWIESFTMSFQAYLDNVNAKTGKTPEDFAKLAARLGLAKHGEIVKWLKSEHSLGHGHATAIAGVIVRLGAPKLRREERVTALFRGNKHHWRAACDSWVSKIRKSAPDVEVKIGATYLSLLRAGKKFAILQPATRSISASSSKVRRLTPGLKRQERGMPWSRIA